MDIEKIQELMETKEAYDKLSKQLDKLKSEVKKQMISEGITKVEHQGSAVVLTKSLRNTPKKDIVNSLVTMGLVNCIRTEIKPDLDILRSEIGGRITQSDFENLVKVSEVYTMNFK